MKIQSAITCYKQRRQLLLTFLTMVTRWSCSEEPPRGSYAIVCKYVCSTSNLYALIGQNLTGEFMRKIYTAIWNLFTLATETDRVLCHLVMFLTVFFHWLYKNEMCDSRKDPYPPPATDGQWKFLGGMQPINYKCVHWLIYCDHEPLWLLTHWRWSQFFSVHTGLKITESRSPVRNIFSLDKTWYWLLKSWILNIFFCPWNIELHWQ